MTDNTEIGPTTVADAAPITLFGTDDPSEVVRKATAVAVSLADVIKDRKLFRTISGRPYTFLEGWTLLGSMLGVFGEVEWSRPITNGYEARVVVRNLSGQTLGAAESQCTRDEKTWADRDDYALRSMAQTRAASKALRLPLGFIMVLAGYEATPADEMPADGPVVARTKAGPSLDSIKARLLERASEHHIDTATLDELIRERIGGGTADEVRAGLIALGTAISRGDFDADVAILESEATTPQDATRAAPAGKAEQMGTDEALAAGAALVK